MFIDDASGQRGRAETRATCDRTALGFVMPVSSWAFVRVPFRKAVVVATYVAIGSAFALLALLDARGALHEKEIHHQARVGEVNAIHAVLSLEETLGLKSPVPTPMQVQAVDAPWTPAPADAKPWTPAPYAPIPLPTPPRTP